MRRQRFTAVLAGLILCGSFSGLGAYPIDGYNYTGIARLDFYDLAQQGVVSGRQLSEGAKLSLEQIRIRGADIDIDTATADVAMNKAVKGFLGNQASAYGVALVDLSDPENPTYAGFNDDYQANVGSVGKILVTLALYQGLANRFPDDIDARVEFLKSKLITADRFIEHDSHKVPIWNVADRKLQHRPIRLGDTASLWEYMDWTLSASSNAAAAMVMREVLLMRHFGPEYPVSDEASSEFLKDASASELRELMLGSLGEVVESNGMDPEKLRQGSFFTRYGKNKVGGIQSYGTPKELLKLLVRMEQGKLVDEFTSQDLKRMLYMTQRRIRYASHPALKDEAVYFKSGSLYSCKEEAGFTCGKYMGNRRNQLASVAIVESPTEPQQLRYMVVVMSNVLKVNSAVAHQTLALRIHRMIEARHAQ